MAAAEDAQSPIRSAAAGRKSPASGRVAGTHAAPLAAGCAGLSFGGAYRAEHAANQRRPARILANDRGGLSLAHRNSADRRTAQQVLQYQRSLFQRDFAGVRGRTTTQVGSGQPRKMTSL